MHNAQDRKYFCLVHDWLARSDSVLELNRLPGIFWNVLELDN